MQPNFRGLTRVRKPYARIFQELENKTEVRVTDPSSVRYILSQNRRLMGLCGFVPRHHNDILVYRKKTPRLVAEFKRYSYFE